MTTTPAATPAPECAGSGQLLTGILEGRDYTATCPACDLIVGITGPAIRPALSAHLAPVTRDHEAAALRAGPTLGL